MLVKKLVRLRSGGSTMFKGFGDRTLNEVRKLAPKEMKIRISVRI